MLYEKRFGPYFCEPVVAGLLDDNTPFLSGMDLIGAPVFTKVYSGDVIPTFLLHSFSTVILLWLQPKVALSNASLIFYSSTHFYIYGQDFVVSGTCTSNLHGMCESLYRPDLSPDELFEGEIW